MTAPIPVLYHKSRGDGAKNALFPADFLSAPAILEQMADGVAARRSPKTGEYVFPRNVTTIVIIFFFVFLAERAEKALDKIMRY